MAQRKRRRGRHARSLRNLTNTKNRNRHGSRSQGGQLGRSLGFEPLEDRRMLALFVVNDLGDFDTDGVLITGSLRNAVLQANTNEGADTIIFGDFLFDGPGSGVISLDSRMEGGPLLLTDPAGVQILGPGAGVLTVFAPSNERVFLVDDTNDMNSSSVKITGLTLSGGSPASDNEDGRGGAILNRESLTLEAVEIRNSFAPAGGGAVFNDKGSFLQIKSSLIRSNTSQQGGGGIQNGVLDQKDNFPTTRIINSTITGNRANGGDTKTGYGGGVVNFAGTVDIEQSTIQGNYAYVGGGGAANMGFDPKLNDKGGPTVFSGPATMNIRSSIIVGNTAAGSPGDVGSVGRTKGSADVSSVPFEPQINSLGFNLFGTLTHPNTSVNSSVTLPPNGPGDVAGIDAGTVFVDDSFGAPWLNDFGGVLPVFMPDINKAGGQLAIDQGDPSNVSGNFDQRGAPFARTFDATSVGFPRMDIGAAEVQVGNFIVGNLIDEIDGRFGSVPVSLGTFPTNILSFSPDLSLREAIEFSVKNTPALTGASGLPQFPGLQGLNQVSFADGLTSLPDPTPGTSAPTIVLTLGELAIDVPTRIQGPAFDLEIDAIGNDLTPGVNDGQGSRVFNVSSTAEIDNLILRGGDRQEFGGAIFSTGDLTVTNSDLLDNATSGSGGAIYVDSGTLLVDSSTIQSNAAAIDGGAIYLASGNATVSNSTISGNTGFRGGGIANADATLLIQYSTITLNTASSTLGSGVASFRDAGAATSIRSSIISGNTINDVQHVKPGANNIVSLGYNLVGTGNAVFAGLFSMPGDQSLVTNPMLAPLARLGGPTPVHRLLPGSPALNAGDPNVAGLGNVPAQDQRGFPFDRIEGANPIDIGAFEVQDNQLLVGDVNVGATFATFVEALDQSNMTPTMEEIVILPSYLGEALPSSLGITDSVDIFGAGVTFTGNGGLDILVDDGNSGSLLDVSLDRFRFENDTRFVSKENLTFSNIQFVNNTATDKNGGAISQQNGKLTINDSTLIGNAVSGMGSSGGAIDVLNGDLEINNSFLSGNSTGILGGKGGAIYLRNGNFTGDYLYITGNLAAAATGDGGGFYARDSTVTLTNAVISGNSTTGSDSEGGGFSAKDSDITLINPSIALNTTVASQSRGGGIFVDGGSLNIQNGNFFGNKTYGQFSSGGGISSVNADVTLTGTSLNGNEVHGGGSHGGGLSAVGGNLTIRDSAVINNQVFAPNTNGGGIYSSGNLSGSQTTSVINSTLSGNSTAGSGGGLFNAGGLTVITHSTITANDVSYIGDAGGVGSQGDASTTLTQVGSSIIAGNLASQAALLADFDNNTVTDGFDFLAWQLGFGKSPATKSDGDANGDMVVDNADFNAWGTGFGIGQAASDVDRIDFPFNETFQSLGYNLIGAGLSVGAFNAPGDQTQVTNPLLGPLANNGGTTQTHALLAGSPAIDAGDPAFIPTSITPTLDFDQRGTGFDRVQGQIDIGAFEFQTPAPLLASAITVSSTGSLLAASVSSTPSLVAANQTETPPRADSMDVGTINGVSTWLAHLGLQRDSSIRPVAPQFSADTLAPYFDELEMAVRDAALTRHAHLSAGFSQLAQDIELDRFVASRQQASSSASELAAEDKVFELLGEEAL